jgi:hypothetical protein
MSESEQSTGNHADRDDDAAEQDSGESTQSDVESKESAEDSEDTTDRSDSEGDDGDGAGGSGEGTRQPGADPEDKEEIEEEREKRLDPENRPDNVEVDNTDREFDPKKGMFTDADGYDQAEEKFPGIGEQGA